MKYDPAEVARILELRDRYLYAGTKSPDTSEYYAACDQIAALEVIVKRQRSIALDRTITRDEMIRAIIALTPEPNK